MSLAVAPSTEPHSLHDFGSKELEALALMTVYLAMETPDPDPISA